MPEDMSSLPETVGNQVTDKPISGNALLTPLTSLRFFAAIHILIFHIAVMPTAEEIKKFREQVQATQHATGELDSRLEAAVEGVAMTDGAAEEIEAGQSPTENRGLIGSGESVDTVLPRGLYAVLPTILARFIERGFCSTSLFFMLSGFVLAFLYLDAEGQQSVSNWDFWRARWIRVYPLHFAMLFLVLPLVFLMRGMFPFQTMWGFPVSKSLYVPLTGVLSLFLFQAWCPEAALSWNFATWALSVVVFFYAMFPLVGRLLKGKSQRVLWFWFWVMPLLNLIPSVLFLAWTDGKSMTNFFWSEVVMRTPLFWLPHFVMAIILARLFKISRYDMRWKDATQAGLVCFGDVAGLLLLVILVTPDAVFQTLFGLGTKPPNFVLRHGVLAPIYAVFIFNLALNRGWFAKLLSHPWLEKLGEASFGIFILQGPLLFPALALFGWASPLLRVSLTVIMVVGTAMLSQRYFERPVARWLKKKWNIASGAG